MNPSKYSNTVPPHVPCGIPSTSSIIVPINLPSQNPSSDRLCVLSSIPNIHPNQAPSKKTSNLPYIFRSLEHSFNPISISSHVTSLWVIVVQHLYLIKGQFYPLIQKTSNFPSTAPSVETYNNPSSEPTYVPSEIPTTSPTIVTTTF